MKHGVVLSVAILAIAGLLTGCSGGGSGGPDPQERLTAAQSTLEKAEAVTINLTSQDVPKNVDGVQAATGTGVIDGDLIKFEGEIQGSVSGMAATVALLAVGDDVYAKLFTPDYEPIDLATLGVPNPTAFFAPETGIASLLAATTDLQAGEEVREGEEVLTEITGKLPGEKVEALLHLGEPGTIFDVTYGLTEKNELRSIVLHGEFWEGTAATYTMLLTDYGVVVPIELPSS